MISNMSTNNAMEGNAGSDWYSDQERSNPLIEAMDGVFQKIQDFKAKAKSYYFTIILSNHSCPLCGGRLWMSGASECSCVCGNRFDPTLSFQKSSCCEASLVRNTFHYACSLCGKSVPSRFLFDEKLFNQDYFREAMQKSRARARAKQEQFTQSLANSRSDEFALLQAPDIEFVPGLVDDLNEFVGVQTASDVSFETASVFPMEDYREHLHSILNGRSMLFSDIAPLIEDRRRDRVWRFVSLIFMWHDREVELTQYGQNILVESV